MAGTLRLILGDQLSLSLASLAACDRERDTILIAEVATEAGYVKHHKKKIALLFSAMRHFSRELEKRGCRVRYTRYDDAENAGSLCGEVERALEDTGHDALELTHPGEYRVLQDMQSWQKKLSIPVSILDDDRFLSTLEGFARWADGRKQLRMEYFYREMRKSTACLVEGDHPAGGKWNYDSANREPLSEKIAVPPPAAFSPDRITREVLQLVEREFSSHFGSLENFNLAVTRKQALEVLERFIEQRLEKFGQYQDAMAQGEPWLFHSHISFYLNCGLLLPLEVIERAERAYIEGDAPLNSVEGFIRQVLGWREYVRGLYWYKMPDYANSNYLQAKRRLPEFFWSANTRMNCLHQCISETRDNAYAHHIQRLMVLGNFLLLAGVDPVDVNEWYLVVYADAYEWVEMPNVTGMILFADGGVMASKPYAASGAYINRMSDYCKGCHYKVKQKAGPQACPFNYLYWDFLDRNQALLGNNPRLGMPYRTLGKMKNEKLAQIREDSAVFFDALDNNETV